LLTEKCPPAKLRSSRDESKNPSRLNYAFFEKDSAPVSFHIANRLIFGTWPTMICRMPRRENPPNRLKGKLVTGIEVVAKANPRSGRLNVDLGDSSSVVALVRRGVAAGMYQWLKESLEVSDQRLSNVVRISQRTVKRRLGEGRFYPDESERLVRIVRLTERAKEVFQGLESARDWLKRPQFALGGEIPLEYADTEPGAQIVVDLLGRIEHGAPV
jgi:putative toxin-antitoxin system antitoxin component (TIGR02293 family)